jgi:hypothetical protein
MRDGVQTTRYEYKPAFRYMAGAATSQPTLVTESEVSIPLIVAASVFTHHDGILPHHYTASELKIP